MAKPTKTLAQLMEELDRLGADEDIRATADLESRLEALIPSVADAGHKAGGSDRLHLNQKIERALCKLPNSGGEHRDRNSLRARIMRAVNPPASRGGGI